MSRLDQRPDPNFPILHAPTRPRPAAHSSQPGALAQQRARDLDDAQDAVEGGLSEHGVDLRDVGAWPRGGELHGLGTGPDDLARERAIVAVDTDDVSAPLRALRQRHDRRAAARHHLASVDERRVVHPARPGDLEPPDHRQGERFSHSGFGRSGTRSTVPFLNRMAAPSGNFRFLLRTMWGATIRPSNSSSLSMTPCRAWCASGIMSISAR